MQPTTTIITRVAVPGVENEQLAAHQIGPDKFVIASVPFVDTTLALGDIVECVRVQQQFHVDRVIVRGGSSTIRILPSNESSFEDIAVTLIGLGCRVEIGPGGMLAASIGPDAPRDGIELWLDGLEAEGLIELAPGYTA